MTVLLLLLRVITFAAGACTVLIVIASSVRTVVIPRGIASRITRLVMKVTRSVFESWAGRNADYQTRDRVLALYGPSSLLLLLMVWITCIIAGYTAMFWAVEGSTLERALSLSGSSIMTLGFEAPRNTATLLLALSEAGIGLIELALLITYMPSIYTAFQRREALVTLLEVRAGSPPSGVEMLLRYWRIHSLDELSKDVWERWEEWFVDVEETHTSLPVLNFFRSPRPTRSWVTAAGAVLDGAALYASTIDFESKTHDSHADLCIRAGYLALNHIADFFELPHVHGPKADDPISIARDEYDQAYERLQAGGLPVQPDRDRAWRDFSGWRVNYDSVLIALAGLTVAPTAPWSADRADTAWRGRQRAPVAPSTHSH